MLHLPRSVVVVSLLILALACSAPGPETTVAEPGPAPAVLDRDLFLQQSEGAAAGDAEAALEPLLASVDPEGSYAELGIDYPLPGSVFPPEIVAPTLLWHEPEEGVGSWLIDVSFSSTEHHISVLSDGKRPEPVIDEECVTPTNQYQEDEYQASARGWTPEPQVWELMKTASVEQDLTVTIMGVSDGSLVSRGAVSFRTSADPVGAPIFYRDVPLMPSEGEKGIVKPLAKIGLPLIKWRLRDISKPSAPAVMEHMPTCANCHSFSNDGAKLAMDVDGPTGDKGAHTLQTVEQHMVIEQDEVFSWNSFQRDPRRQSFGLFPRISPDGRYVAATVKESVFVQNYRDYRFLQTFYPTRGIIAIYDRQTDSIAALPGADTAEWVQTNPVWSPDGSEIVFLRARARDSYGDGPLATYANDPNETQIQYDLYRIPFNDGKGGTPTAVIGASGNGMSNSFPAFSPDGRWLVYVQCKNGLLMRPDSKLSIIPAAGGEARLLSCNTSLMNSWHSWSPNSRWLAFSSKSLRPYTQIFLTHIDASGNDTPAVLLPNSTADNRAVNLPEFANIPQGAIADITSPAVDFRRHLDRGTELVDEGKLDQAYQELRQSIELKDDYPTSLVTMASVLNDLGRYQEAEEYCKKALDLDLSLYLAHFHWGNALHYEGKHGEAMQQYVEALRIKPDYAKAQNNLGILLQMQGRPEQALDQYQSASQADPEYAAPYCNWGNALMQLGRPEEALGRYERAIELDPGYTDALEAAGMVLDRLGRREQALGYLQRAVGSNPDRESAHAALAAVLARAGRIEEAVEQYRETVRVNPANHQAEAALGSALLYLDRPEEAAQHFRKALAIEAGNDAARNNLAWVLATSTSAGLRNGQEAVEHAELACRNTRYQNARFVFTLATAYAEAGRFDDAVKTGRQAQQLASAAGNRELAAEIGKALKRYEQSKPFAAQ